MEYNEAAALGQKLAKENSVAPQPEGNVGVKPPTPKKK